MGQGRPGRLQGLAYDATPMSSNAPDIDARIGWLLAVSRLHHDDPQRRDGPGFVAAMAAAGVQVSRSLVSRWESGSIPVSYEGMLGYERVLGLRPGELVSITGYIRTALPGVRVRVTSPRLDPTSPEYADRLDELVVLVQERAASALDWQELGWHLAVAPQIYLPKPVWESIADQIVRLLPRGVHAAYRLYATAAMNISAVARSHEFLVDSIRDYLAVPEAQVILNPVGMLDQLPTRSAASLVLDLVENPPSAAAYRLAVWLAAQKIRTKTFSEQERARLEMLVLSKWRSNSMRAGADLAELIAVLPEGLRGTLTTADNKAGRRRLGYVVEHGEELVANRAEALSRHLAEAARGTVPMQVRTEPDRMLGRLVREGLFHRDSERRHLAGLLLSASPYAAGVADQMLNILADPEGPRLLRVRAATLVRYVGGTAHRSRMIGLIDDPEEDVGIAVAQGLGHLPFAATSDQALRAALGPRKTPRGSAQLYGLGMSGSPVLRALAGSPTAPDWQRLGARWWSDLGPALSS